MPEVLEKASGKRVLFKKMPATKKDAEKTEAKPKLRIKLRAYDHKLIDKSARQIVEIALRNGAEILGPVPLPVEVRKYTVNRSTFVHKDAREQFEMRIHKRFVDVISPNQRVIDSLKTLTLPTGVDIEVKSIL